MPLFDSYLIVDWSAASYPKCGKDSIWWALYRRSGDFLATGNPETRAEAVGVLAYLLNKEAVAKHRVLAGFDFAFGYPKGFAEIVTGDASALALWDWLSKAVHDEIDNTNNRFEVAAWLNMAAHFNGQFEGPGPFWGRPEQINDACTKRLTSEDIMLLVPPKGRSITYNRIAKKRIVENQPNSSAKPVWQLNGAGVVGGQVLVGLPALNRLRKNKRLKQLKSQPKVWPFETGLNEPETEKTRITLVEIYPSILDESHNRIIDRLREDEEAMDSAQVRIMATALAMLDKNDKLADLFTLNAVKLGNDQRRVVEKEEGWILGVGYEEPLRKAANGASPELLRDSQTLL